MENHIRNRTVLITGATSGFGRQLAFDLLEYEVDLILVSRSQEKLRALREELARHTRRALEIHALDVRDRLAVEKTLAEILKRRKVHILVNNAGLALGLDPIDRGNPDHWDTMIDTNLKGLLYVSKPVIAQMRELDTAHVVNIGSMAGRMPYPGGNAYCASKAAVHALGEAMNADLLGTNVKQGEHHRPQSRRYQLLAHPFRRRPGEGQGRLRGIHPAERGRRFTGHPLRAQHPAARQHPVHGYPPHGTAQSLSAASREVKRGPRPESLQQQPRIHPLHRPVVGVVHDVPELLHLLGGNGERLFHHVPAYPLGAGWRGQ